MSLQAIYEQLIEQMLDEIFLKFGEQLREEMHKNITILRAEGRAQIKSNNCPEKHHDRMFFFFPCHTLFWLAELFS